jgi:hypothetical protein
MDRTAIDDRPTTKAATAAARPRRTGSSPARSPSRQRNPYLAVAAADAARYERCRHLAALLPLWPRELADYSRTGTELIIARLATALRLERQRGRAGHWCYDLNRHQALISALRGERAHLAALE